MFLNCYAVFAGLVTQLVCTQQASAVFLHSLEAPIMILQSDAHCRIMIGASDILLSTPNHAPVVRRT